MPVDDVEKVINSEIYDYKELLEINDKPIEETFKGWFQQERQRIRLNSEKEKETANSQFYKQGIRGSTVVFWAICLFLIVILFGYGWTFFRFLNCLNGSCEKLSAFLLESVNQFKGVIAGIMIGIVTNKLYDMSKKLDSSSNSELK